MGTILVIVNISHERLNMISFTVTIILGFMSLSQTPVLSYAASDASLEERFANPPAASRILPIRHHLPDDENAQDAMLQEYMDKGFGGMVTNVHFSEYMDSEVHWQAFLRSVKEAKQRGMALWLYDERGYPSGLAGGKTMEGHPEWEARGLLIAQVETSGGMTQVFSPPGSLVLATAYPVINGALNIAGAVDIRNAMESGTLNWDAPAGTWRVMVITEDSLYEGTHAAVSLCDKLPYINLLMPEPTKRFLEVTHDNYVQKLGEDLGPYFVATFTDEPSLMSLFMRPQPWSVLPWSSNLPVEFEKQYGRPLLPLLPHLVWGSGGTAEKARYEYWNVVGDLVSANYFGQIRDWCRAHGLPSGGHLLMEEGLLTHVPLYGNFYQCVRQLDAPSMDCLTSLPEQVPWQVARLIGSVADVCNRDVTMSESSDHVQQWRREGDDRPKVVVTEAQIRGACNRLMIGGITTITSYYRFTDLTKEQLLRLNEWVGRCCTMLKGGTQVTDVAVVYPAESLATHFLPSREWTKDAPADAQRIAETYALVSNLLYTSGRDFTYVDSQVLAESTVIEGQLQFNDLAWRVVVLPCVDTLSLAAWQNLYAFWKSGGTVIALGALPVNSDMEFPCKEVQEMAKAMFSNEANVGGGHGVYVDNGQEALLPRMVNTVVPPHVRIPKGATLRTTHRRIDGHEVFFVINDSIEPWSGEIGIRAKGNATQWNPATGSVSDIQNPQEIPLKLEPYGGMLFRFDDFIPERNDTSTFSMFPDAMPVSENMPEMNIGKGKYVEAHVEEESETASWTADARLTKSDVDTFLFLCFTYSDTVDISDREFLVFDLKIPTPQPCNKTLLVVLRDAAGVEYLADSHVLLSSPYEDRVFVPTNQFTRADWCAAKDKTLDLNAIKEIRIGWGGYLGTENETVSFNSGVPFVEQ